VDPNYPRAHHLLGLEHSLRGDREGAIREFEIAIANYGPDDKARLSQVYNDLGCEYYDMGETAKATHAWKISIEYDPNNEEAVNNFRFLGRLLPSEFEGKTEVEIIQEAPRPEDAFQKLLEGKSFPTISAMEEEKERIIALWNNTARAELGGRTPAEVYGTKSEEASCFE